MTKKECPLKKHCIMRPQQLFPSFLFPGLRFDSTDTYPSAPRVVNNPHHQRYVHHPTFQHKPTRGKPLPPSPCLLDAVTTHPSCQSTLCASRLDDPTPQLRSSPPPPPLVPTPRPAQNPHPQANHAPLHPRISTIQTPAQLHTLYPFPEHASRSSPTLHVARCGVLW